MSPVAWQHIFLNGHYAFISEGKELDLDAMIEGLTLSMGSPQNFGGFPLTTPNRGLV
ncbi:hypothetical protein HH682_10320 [Rosenbergiella sp. S61]|uniref:Tn3 transposase DDE domain-containing protein n=1 Tax=Rosenbergiella gaditana TaxID=2726987 RepID=A0ABS5T038_9GAMM|nr:hypothetical protein [Rosenbergiella gaditana]MBT0724817.1 hypothetical protein [Rosenbergiella gaditana]